LTFTGPTGDVRYAFVFSTIGLSARLRSAQKDGTIDIRLTFNNGGFIDVFLGAAGALLHDRLDGVRVIGEIETINSIKDLPHLADFPRLLLRWFLALLLSNNNCTLSLLSILLNVDRSIFQ
jgi:hypothetical protein